VHLSGKPLGIVALASATEVWVSTMGTDSVYVLRPSQDAIVARFASDGAEPARMAVTRANGILVTNTGSNTLTFYDAQTRHVQRRLAMPGAGAKGLAVDSLTGVAYVSLMDSHQVVAIDVPAWRVTWVANVGGSPERMAIVPVATTDGRTK
jgi:DNA-binding beta-propeller fold protein YncE